MSIKTINKTEVPQQTQVTSQEILLPEILAPKVIWGLYAFRKGEDDLAETCAFKGISAAVLQEILEQPEDDPMYDVYPVNEAQAAQLQAYTDHPIDLQTYDYFVECYAE